VPESVPGLEVEVVHFEIVSAQVMYSEGPSGVVEEGAAVLRDADLELQAAKLIPCQEVEAARGEVSD
jgi:hypothetical protein